MGGLYYTVLDHNGDERELQFSDMGIKEIPLTRGKTALIDNDDFERVNKIKWCATYNKGRWYAAGHVPGTANKVMSLHSFIMYSGKGIYVDHIDHNGLNNCKFNLRIATNRQNQHNRLAKKGKRFKGTTWRKGAHSWMARIVIDGKNKYLGDFKDERDAAIKYNEAAKKYFGEFALLNEV